MKKRVVPALAAAIGLCCAPCFGWGTRGHTIVNQVAAGQMAGKVPSFVTSGLNAFAIAFLGPEMDDLKGSGLSWDSDNDPGHYVDVGDDGTIARVVALQRLPKDREAYDSALRRAGTDQYRQGFLPYEILDGWQQLREDFAYWRADNYAASRSNRPSVRGTAACDRAIEQQLIVRDLGVWGHFVGDGSQPLHVTVHYNGWGRYSNPDGFTQSRRTHSAFESDFVNRYARVDAVWRYASAPDALPEPRALLSQRTVMAQIARYLRETNSTVNQFYAIEKSRGFVQGSPQAVTFAERRIAAGASELRDLTIWAWQDSANESVGYPSVRVSDVVAGTAQWPVVIRPCSVRV